MKKTTKFITISFVGFLLIAGAFRIVAKPSFSMEETGDRQVLQGITYQSDIATQSGLVRVLLENGNLSYSLQKTKGYMEAKYLSQQEAPEEEATTYIQIEVSDLQGVQSDWQRTQPNTFDDCGEEEQRYTSGILQYALYDESEWYIDTGLQLIANDTITIAKKRCMYYESQYQDSYTVSNFQSERYFQKEQLIAKIKDTTYFMPLQTASMIGTNHLYRLTDSQTVEAIVVLPEGRVYEELHAIGTQLVILSHTAQTFYVNVYDEQGVLLYEHAYDYEQPACKLQSFSTQRYLLWQDEKTCWIYDSETGKVEVLEESKGSKLQAVLEQNDMLYMVSSLVEESKESLLISVYQNQDKVYEANIVLLETALQKEMNPPVNIVEWGYFVR